MRGNEKGEEEWRGMEWGMERKEKERPLYFYTKIHDVNRKKNHGV